jgi:hypothetical protein
MINLSSYARKEGWIHQEIQFDCSLKIENESITRVREFRHDSS